MLSHDERAAERNHHQDAEQSAEQAHQHHTADLEVETQDHNRRHGDAEAEGDGFTAGTGSLDDVILEDRRVATAEFRPKTEQGERNHRHRDGGADGDADLEHEVERRGAKKNAQQGANNERSRCELVYCSVRRNVGTE